MVFTGFVISVYMIFFRNGYRLVICRSKCEETTTTTTTTTKTTSGPTQKIPLAPLKLPSVPLQNKPTVIPPPKNGANGSCDMDGQKFLDGLTGGNNGSSGTGSELPPQCINGFALMYIKLFQIYLVIRRRVHIVKDPKMLVV